MKTEPKGAAITGNPYATGKKTKYGHELIQRCRAAVISALEIVDKRGKKISELLAEELEKNPLKFMELASKFCPKDLQVEIDDLRNNAEQFTDSELADIAARSRTRTTQTESSKKAVH